MYVTVVGKIQQCKTSLCGVHGLENRKFGGLCKFKAHLTHTSSKTSVSLVSVAVITISVFVWSLLFYSHWVHIKYPCQREILSCNYSLLLTHKHKHRL